MLPSDVPESAGAEELLEKVLATPTLLHWVYVYGGYSGADFAAQVADLKPSLEVEVVKRSDANSGFKVVPKRLVVERTFGWLIQGRRLARDYERLPEAVAGWIHVAMIRIMRGRLA